MKIKFILIIFLTFISAISFGQTLSESNTERYFEFIKKNPRKLYQFLYRMPKGGDLHTHQYGAAFAENMLRYASKDNLCMDQKTFSAFSNQACSPANILNRVIKNSRLYTALVDAWSMRHFKPVKESGHDHFFNAFDKFFVISITHGGEILSELLKRAESQNELYVELMITPDYNQSGLLGKQLGFDPDFGKMRARLLASGMGKIVTNISETMNKDEAKMRQILLCATKRARPGCNIKIRYLYQVLRAQSPEMVFAQLLAGFESATKDPRIVGINMVQPEDGTIALRDYKLHMRMIAFLRKFYPGVNVSLHAGELNEAIASTKDLKFHINEAVNVANAQRIGHGVDIRDEDNMEQLLQEMATKRIMVEINLSSNDYILNAKGKDHPLPLYMRYGVPVALSTDDEGITRSNLTQEYQKAVMTYQFTYPILKTLVRNSIAYSFLSGQALWQDAKDYRQVIPQCAKDILGSAEISSACKLFLETNEKARMQWELEKRFKKFEEKF